MQILYSNTIFTFLKRARSLARKILSEEAALEVGRSRFLMNRRSYPLHFVAFEHPSKLGYFQADFYEIGINKAFLFESEEKLLDLLRHELAHYLTFIEYGPHIPHHGSEFHSICKKYGWGSEVSRAVVKIERAAQNEKILEKVRKLLSLAESPHQREAEAATLKAQELLLKYNLELKEECDEMLLVRILPQKRSSAKLQAISSILRSFLVHPIFNHGKGVVYLELLGERVNVEVAEYVAHFLDKKFELLWKQAKDENPKLRGLASKNSFFRGLSEGYLCKTQIDSHALIKMEKQLIDISRRVYPHLTSARGLYKHNEAAAQMGQKKGKSLIIQPAVEKNKSRLRLSLPLFAKKS
ncbi:MAG: Protein SprT [Chlamydiae bacterium]|nr:Protein SprT [Chlamydiota bacterium]